MPEPHHLKDVRLCPESARDNFGFIPLRSRYLAGHEATFFGITQRELKQRAHDARVPDDEITAMHLREILDYRRERVFVRYRHLLQYLSGKLGRMIRCTSELTCSELRAAIQDVDKLPNICKRRPMRRRDISHREVEL